MNVSREYFTAINKVAGKDIPVLVVERARRSLLDYLAVTCAGAIEGGSVPEWAERACIGFR